jgi:hypothetical protein
MAFLRSSLLAAIDLGDLTVGKRYHAPDVGPLLFLLDHTPGKTENSFPLRLRIALPSSTMQ